ncbi:DUF2061 domain-containing protein [Noviherbaspirillum aridicola]|uniref:DUF2061 domain-containing protein n=1 Tax=Noviherbaspirillum aridicola TaxID=2849687 RepID=A0ABQ4Q805_9BURK|nr:DUF2061 domain-containing protein [Noviherbaspirillum aridicola]GIZ53356.1 hypothetical protein NCCP691_33700 [Noviherbaspirillum aridicola]
MVIAAKKVSQVGTHMAIAFAIMYAMTGSVVFGGLAVLVEPVINVLLLPYHQRLWAGIRRRAPAALLAVAGEKLSQTAMHMAVAFAVMFWATGSVAFGGLAAVLEPVLNVALMPWHDRLWERLEAAAGPRPRLAVAG